MRPISTMDELSREYDRIPHREGRYAELAIEIEGGYTRIEGFAIYKSGTILLVPVTPLKARKDTP